MSDHLSPLAGKPAPASILIDVAALLDAYTALTPDPAVAAQRVAFGTSGHRGTSTERSFNEAHILAITQAICEYRQRQGISGPLFLGADTHALSAPAQHSALEVLAAHGVHTRIAPPGDFTPTPAVSHAVLTYNRGRTAGLADGIVVTPSHNPPDSGGFKYNPTNGGPADTAVTGWIEQRANALLEQGVAGVRRLAAPERSGSLSVHDFRSAYVADLGSVIDFDTIRSSGVRLGVDPLGGAGVHYWARIAERYRIPLEVVSETVDPRFAFMTVDWDGKIRMDPSSPYAMQRLIALKDRFDVAAGCDTDHDRHGIVARSGLLPANHYLVTMIDYLFRERPRWPSQAGVGKTVVSTSLIDAVTRERGRPLFELPVGFKWFASGLEQSSLGFAGEESAGASFLRRDGTVWTTDKDGLVPALLAAEITARTGKDPAANYQDVVARHGPSFADRVEGPATPQQKARLSKLTGAQLKSDTLAGEPITAALDRAPANQAPFGGIKVMSASGWFAARPSGTESLYKIYAESFRSVQHLQALLGDARRIVDAAIAG